MIMLVRMTLGTSINYPGLSSLSFSSLPPGCASSRLPACFCSASAACLLLVSRQDRGCTGRIPACNTSSHGQPARSARTQHTHQTEDLVHYPGGLRPHAKPVSARGHQLQYNTQTHARLSTEAVAPVPDSLYAVHVECNEFLVVDIGQRVESTNLQWPNRIEKRPGLIPIQRSPPTSIRSLALGAFHSSWYGFEKRQCGRRVCSRSHVEPTVSLRAFSLLPSISHNEERVWFLGGMLNTHVGREARQCSLELNPSPLRRSAKSWTASGTQLPGATERVEGQAKYNGLFDAENVHANK